jgi:hypothetical protein
LGRLGVTRQSLHLLRLSPLSAHAQITTQPDRLRQFTAPAVAHRNATVSTMVAARVRLAPITSVVLLSACCSTEFTLTRQGAAYLGLDGKAQIQLSRSANVILVRQPGITPDSPRRLDVMFVKAKTKAIAVADSGCFMLYAKNSDYTVPLEFCPVASPTATPAGECRAVKTNKQVIVLAGDEGSYKLVAEKWSHDPLYGWIGEIHSDDRVFLAVGDSADARLVFDPALKIRATRDSSNPSGKGP